MKKLLYLSDFSLPNKSAYTVHVLKICEAFSKKKIQVKLIVNSSKVNFKKVKRDYLLDHSFNIHPLRKRKIKLNLIQRIFDTIKILLFLKNEKFDYIISRNIIASVFLAFFQIKNILEIHTETTGITKYILFLTKIRFIKKNIKFIYIHKNLKKFLNLEKNKSIVLDDAVKLNDFNKYPQKKTKKEFVYTGSFVNGKGVEIILKLAEFFKEYNFNLYGNIDTMEFHNKKKCSKFSNIKIYGFKSYSSITKVLIKTEYLLMPYQKKISVLKDNVDVSRYISPLKMFEYLAAKKIIFASKHNVYSHILKNNYNSILLIPNNINDWVKKISKVLKNPKKYQPLKKNSYLTAKKYSWDSRCSKILNFYFK